MSMLTPPGMRGRKYRVTGNSYPRIRRPRRRRRTVAVIGGVLAVGVLGIGTLQLVDVFAGGDTERDASAGANPTDREECDTAGAPPAPEPPDLPSPETITVNVYNATDRSGLAQTTADALAERGFLIGAVDNAPEDLDGTVASAGLLRGAPDAEENGVLTVLGAHAAGTEHGAPREGGEEGMTAEPGGREVDLVLGDAFEALAEPAEVEAALAALVAASPEEPDC
ncbi:LytR C-terminal domain-containing protein [Streptomyces calidiresistens]|uniref:LytR family transcriptional regulator n=1 Tax=Streptomyces calidiresistens TaxID=1485586 RepID=A0A7W3XVZ8_9ACTN|nr:LytR C-terminal domain-containing protein [Streptomyces calidiresistens]MBB0229266.1 LytR family transcriptional regulator [Streptomyces calidiresistens]